MNRIYKVIYSKVKQCYIVVSELAKSHVKSAHGSNGQQKAALTAAVLLALGAFSFVGMPVAQAADGTESMKNNDYVGANGYYWYFDEKTNQWTKYPYKISSINNNRSWQKLPNYEGGGAKEPGAVTAGLYAQAGEQTVTIGNRNAGQSKGSVFIGELDEYNDGRENNPVGMKNNYVTAVGFQSNATGWGSIAIGSNAVAENTKETSQVVDYEGNAGTSGTVQDDNYGIKLKPSIKWSSVALGYSAKAKDGNIAIGAYSDATDTNSATPYVSVGSSTLQRRITNVADGTGDTDVATVGQMNKAIESIGTTGWNLSTNGNSSSTTITSGKTVDFSPAVDGKNGTTDHKNVKISNDGSKVKISLNKDIVLGEATNGNGGSLNVYSDSTEASNLGNRVSIDGSTVSVNYGKEDGTSGTKRGVVLGVGEDYNNNAQGYIAFNNIDAKGTIGSTYLHSATDAPNDLKGRLVYSNAIDGTEYIANLDDGITFAGDVNDTVPEGYTQTPTKLDTTLNITGGAKTADDLTSGNIGVVSTPAAENADGTKTQASKLEIKLNKDLKGITSITSQTTDGTTTSGATITLGTNGTTISGGDVNVSTHKITGLKDGTADTDAATVGQMNTAIGNAKTKYYSVTNSLKLGDYRTNENNDGAADYALAGMAAGYETGTTGIASTVAGSYSGVIGSGLQGAAAVSVGTVNVNKNMDPNKKFSGVANSIVGQANMTTNSNAAIIYGAGNTVKNSYRDIDTKNASEIKAAAESGDVTKLGEALQKAVPTSGGQVMVMGGGNNVESAYMSQVVGVGNTVKGNQVENTKGEWGTDTSDTAIKDYNSEKSSQYNYVDGFNNEVINGKHDYVIGANNKLSGDSYDDDKVLPIKRSNKSNIVIGDNHTLTRKQNTVIIGSSDTENTQTIANDAVIIGHNANATSKTGADNAVAIGRKATATGGNAVTIGVNTSAGENSITIGSESSAISGQNIAIGRYAKVDGYKVTKAVALGQKAEAQVTDGVAIGSNSIATVAGNSVEGYDPTTGRTSTDPTATWKATKAAVSIGKADGTVTRQINGVAAGTNDTDAVNVAQIKKLASINASNIGANLQYGADGTTAATNTDKTKNKEAWATAIGTGTVTKDDDGSKQMVTGKTVYDALHGGLDNITVGKDGQNGKDGSIGIAGQNGKDGYSITYIKTEQGAAGVDGTDGITRVVYQDKDGNGKHTFATLDDGLKFKGDDSTVIARKLNEQLNITGGADSTKLTDKNIGVNSSTDGLKIQLAKNLAGITSIANQTTTGKGDAQTTTGAKIDLKDDGSISVNSGKITDVKSGLTATDGTYADTDKNNAANIGDVHSMIEKEAGNTDDKLALKANVAADNIGTHITDTTAQKTNLDNWGAAIGTGAVADSTNEHANQLVTGKTVYDALHGGLDNITVGKDGKDGKDAVSISSKDGVGHIGLTGPAGTNGKDGASIDITVKNGYDKDGKDGKDGINGENGVDGMSLTRIVYEDKNGEHQVATLEDGLKFKGDDSTVIAKKLNNTMEIIGGADKENLTDKNIGVNSTTDGKKLKVQLAKDLTGITSISNQTTTKDGNKDVTTGAKITLGTDGTTTITGGDINVGGNKVTNIKSALDGAKDANGKDATIATATGDALKNAANLGDLQNVYNDISAKADKASTSHTALTVEGNTSAGKGKDEKTKEDVYAGKNILLHESTDENGKVTYDLKLAKDISIGKPGKDGEDGKIGIDGRDGHIGLNGSDGITVRGLDGENGTPGKDGVTITGPKGADGTDGKVGISGKAGKDAVSISGKDGVGHIGLTGPAGTNGKDGASIDITVKNGYDDVAKGIDGSKGVDGKDGITRIVYTDKTGDHQVATMEDGLKFKGDDSTVIAKKLNNTLDIIGGAKGDLTEGNIGVNSTKEGKLKVQLAKDLTGITSISNQTTTKDGNKDVTTGAKITLGTDGTTTITGGDINVGGNKVTNIKSALDGAKDANGKDATIATATGDALKNAANLGDLQNVYNDISAKADKASTSHTALTVEGNTSAGKGKDEKTKEDVYAGKNILLHESTDENGKVTYDLKLAKDISIGKPGKDGEDGKIGIDGRDGHIGLNGSDGITVRGLDGENGTPGKDGVTITGPKGADGTDGKVGISGKAGKDAVSISGKDGVGHIGLTGPAGTNGKDGASIDITVKNGSDDTAKGINGTNGVDGKDGITRIVYTDKNGEHQVATMEDGLKFKGDDGTEIAKKLNNTMEIIGGADSTKLTDKNIGVNSDGDKLKVQLSKDLTGMNSTTYTTTTGEGESATTSTTVVNGNGLTITDGPSITNKGIDGGNKVITNVGSGIEKNKNGKYTVTKQNQGNAANIGDVQNMVNDAKTELTDGANGLNNKANIDASNIGANLKNADGSVASAEDQKANAEKWGSAIGTGEIKADDGRMVTGKTVYDEVRPTKDGSYVKKDKTTGENLSALDSKIGSMDKDGNYIKKDDSISNNLSALDTHVKANENAIKKNSESIQNITNNVKNLSDNAVQYDKDSNKTTVTLAGKGGTTITNVKAGALSDSSTDAVNGKQLYNEQKAREAADEAITENVTNNTNEITKIKNGEGFTNTGKTIIKNLSKDAVQVKAGDRIKVDEATDEKTGNKTYTISANNNGTVAKGDGNLISGDTLYKEVHVDKDGSYIKAARTVGQNLSALDSGLKTTSDLIHTNDKGDTIQIGADSKATKVDISGKDAKGNKTGRVITGVVSDASDPNSAANVGYVNGITAASNEQIYRDMNMQYNHVENDISRAAAGSNALAALHPMQEFDPDDKAQFALGYGHYRNSNAGAVGAFYQPDENSLFSFGVSFGNGDAGLNAGVTFKFGPGGSDHHALTKTQMAKVIDAQSKEIDELKKDNADKDKRIDALEQKMTEILARLDKSQA